MNHSKLVENALDANATIIEIKLKNYGIDSIEVSDNGDGISPRDYAGVAMKHYTSKLHSFSDLSSVTSFGFRGEALNALCELSGGFSVLTKQRGQDLAAALSFHRDGRLEEAAPASRGVGTTVTVTELFEVLPVRRSEFIRYIYICACSQYMHIKNAYLLLNVFNQGYEFNRNINRL